MFSMSDENNRFFSVRDNFFHLGHFAADVPKTFISQGKDEFDLKRLETDDN